SHQLPSLKVGLSGFEGGRYYLTLGPVKQPQGRMVIMQLDNLAGVLGENPVGFAPVSNTA
ncbi:MAG: hypothetical protein ACRCT2_04010, partial [Plesiomonas shigelloides]